MFNVYMFTCNVGVQVQLSPASDPVHSPGDTLEILLNLTDKQIVSNYENWDSTVKPILSQVFSSVYILTHLLLVDSADVTDMLRDLRLKIKYQFN